MREALSVDLSGNTVDSEETELAALVEFGNGHLSVEHQNKSKGSDLVIVGRFLPVHRLNIQNWEKIIISAYLREREEANVETANEVEGDLPMIAEAGKAFFTIILRNSRGSLG